MCRKNKETGLKDKCDARLEAEEVIEDVQKAIKEMDAVYEAEYGNEPKDGSDDGEDVPESTKAEKVKAGFDVEIKLSGYLANDAEPEEEAIQTLKALVKAQDTVLRNARKNPDVNIKKIKIAILKFASEELDSSHVKVSVM